jgi:hypothetical protein
MNADDEVLIESSSVAAIPDADEHAEASARYARAVVAGTLLALVSAVLYTATNMCLRAAAHCDIYWVSCLKAVPTLLVAAAIVLHRKSRNVPVNPGITAFGKLLLTGLLAHIGGNVAFQYGLSIVGLAAAVPLTFSTIIVGGALLGRFYLGEGVTWRSAGAMALLCLSIGLLGMHTDFRRRELGSDQLCPARRRRHRGDVVPRLADDDLRRDVQCRRVLPSYPRIAADSRGVRQRRERLANRDGGGGGRRLFRRSGDGRALRRRSVNDDRHPAHGTAETFVGGRYSAAASSSS